MPYQPPGPSGPLTHKLPLSTIPRRPDGRRNWSSFYALMRAGDQVRLPKADYPGLHSRAGKCGLRLRCDMHHSDSTFTITVMVCKSNPRAMIMDALSSLPDGKLKALYQAAVKGGIFAAASSELP